MSFKTNQKFDALQVSALMNVAGLSVARSSLVLMSFKDIDELILVRKGSNAQSV